VRAPPRLTSSDQPILLRPAGGIEDFQHLPDATREKIEALIGPTGPSPSQHDQRRTQTAGRSQAKGDAGADPQNAAQAHAKPAATAKRSVDKP